MKIFKSIGKVLGIGNTAKDVFDKNDGHLKNFGSWIGSMKFTAEEMAEMDAETAAGVRKFALDTLNESTDRSKTRRELAIFIIKYYSLLLFLSVMVFPFNKEWAQYVFQVAAQTHIGWLVLGVGTFFWGAHVMRTAVSK